MTFGLDEIRHESRFVEEHLHRARIAEARAVDGLDRHEFREARRAPLFGEPHLAHAARSENADEAVFAFEAEDPPGART
jgi:hypothetical protein